MISKIDGQDFGNEGMAAYCSALGQAASGSSHVFTVLPGALSDTYDWSQTGTTKDVSVVLP